MRAPDIDLRAGIDRVTDEDFAAVALGDVTHCRIRGQPITRLPALGGKLVELAIGACPQLASLAGIERCAGLSSIVLEGVEAAWLVRELPRLAELPDLARLTLVSATGRIDAAIAAIARLPSLLGLALVQCDFDQAAAYAALGASRTLQRLSLERQFLWSCSDALAPLQRLRALELVGCTHVPASIGALAALERLVVRPDGGSGYGRLRSLPMELGRCRALVELVIDGPIVSIPEQVCACTRLETLEVRGGRMTALPSSLGNLQRLRRLAVSTCDRLRALPESIGALAALRVLELPERADLEVPDAIERLTLETVRGHADVLARLTVLPPSDRVTVDDSRGEEAAIRIVTAGYGDALLQVARRPHAAAATVDTGDTAPALAALAGAAHLVDLEVRHDGPALPDEVGDLRGLRRLHVRGALRGLPDALGELRDLERLTIDCPNLADVPDVLHDLGKLAHLEVTASAFARFPAAFARCPALATVIVRGACDLAPIGRVRGLRDLRITTDAVPVYLAELLGALAGTPLALLQIDAPLDEIPSEIGVLVGLERLMLGRTNVRELPPAIRALAALDYVVLRADFTGDARTQLPPGEWVMPASVGGEIAYQRSGNVPDRS